MTQRLPILFIGHGSPMNAIENNAYSRSWKEIGTSLPLPRAILMLSAHWITEGKTLINTTNTPEIIYDMYGFPPELYHVTYPAPGSKAVAEEISNTIIGIKIQEDATHGLDHGAWSVLVHLFPQADIPVIQMSLDYSLAPEKLFDIGRELAKLREKGVFIIGSGNIVHNLSRIDWSGTKVYSWAKEFDERVAKAILTKHYMDILDFHSWGDISELAHPSYDHLLPLFPLLGAVHTGDISEFYTPEISLGTLSMRSILWK